MKLSKYLAAALLLIAPATFAAPASDKDDKDEAKRLENAGTVIEEILNVPDNIPQDLLDKARCVVVLPSVVKAAFIVGGSYGRGVMVCRTGEHFRGRRDAAANTDAYLRAEMLSYSRSRGVFAGISLEGSTLRPDNDANRKLYGKDASAAEIITESKVEAPEAGRKLISRLQKASPTLKP